VAGQVQRLERPFVGDQSRGEKLERAGLLDDDAHRQQPRRVEDRRLLGLVIEFVLAFRRGGHEHQLQIAVERLERRGRGADPARDDEQLDFVEP
jgi:hypothetical protein